MSEEEASQLSGYFRGDGHLHRLIRGCIQDFVNVHGSELTRDNMDSLARRLTQNIKGVVLKGKHKEVKPSGRA